MELGSRPKLKPVWWAKRVWREAAAHHRSGRRAPAKRTGPASVDPTISSRTSACGRGGLCIRDCVPSVTMASVVYLHVLYSGQSRCEMLRAPDESAFWSLLSDIGPPRVSEVDLNPQHRPKCRATLCGCKINPHSPPAGIKISCTRFFEFSTFFGRGLQVEKGARNAVMSLKTWEVEIGWWARRGLNPQPPAYTAGAQS